MPNSENTVPQNKQLTQKRHYNRKLHIDGKINEIPNQYKGDIRRFKEYCNATDQFVGIEAMLDYLYVSLTEQRIKKTTWERRLAAIKKYLSVIHKIDFRSETRVIEEFTSMRKMYCEEQYSELIHIQGKSAVNKAELMELINLLPIREKAICLVNLITASRPNEMVRLKVEDFDLINKSVKVYLKKQKRWHTKRLTQEVINTIDIYISTYQLKPEDYFVGRVYRNGRYQSALISEVGYFKALQRWIGLTGYNFRKSQVLAMHEAGADLFTIAKQTGHKSVETLAKCYLEVPNSTVDKYL